MPFRVNLHEKTNEIEEVHMLGGTDRNVVVGPYQVEEGHVEA